MSVANPVILVFDTPRQCDSARLFGICAITIAVLAAALAGWMPLGFSIVTVFLFAGPHNWIEFRYFLSQMPARWGPLRRYFLVAIGGVLCLAAIFITYPQLGRAYGWTGEQWLTASAGWNSLLVLWITALAIMRARQVAGRSWPWAAPVGLIVVAIVWLAPLAWDLVLVYLHPLVALWFLDRTLQRRRPRWRRAYHLFLLAIPRTGRLRPLRSRLV